MIGLGTLVNAGAVLVGSGGTLLVKALFRRHSPAKSTEKGQQLSDLVMKGVGLCVLYIGISGALKNGSTLQFYDSNTLILILSVVIGALVGHLCDLDGRLNRLGQWLERKFGQRTDTPGGTSLATGFITASLLFCVGAMTVIGSIQDGLQGDPSTLFAKSLLDGISAVIYTGALGAGVLFSALFVLLYQGLLTGLAVVAAPLLSEAVQTEMTVVGSVLIIGLALNLLGITKLKVMNYLPAIFLPLLLCLFL